MNRRDWRAQDKRQSSEWKSKRTATIACWTGKIQEPYASHKSWVMANEIHLDTCFTYVNNFYHRRPIPSNLARSNAQSKWINVLEIPLQSDINKMQGTSFPHDLTIAIQQKSFNESVHTLCSSRNRTDDQIYMYTMNELSWIRIERERAKESNAKCSWLIYRISNRFAGVRFEKYVTWFLTITIRRFFSMFVRSFGRSTLISCLHFHTDDRVSRTDFISITFHFAFNLSPIQSPKQSIFLSFTLHQSYCFGFTSTIGAHLYIKSSKSVANKIMTNKTNGRAKTNQTLAKHLHISISHAVTLLGKREYFKWNRLMRNTIQHKKSIALIDQNSWIFDAEEEKPFAFIEIESHLQWLPTVKMELAWHDARKRERVHDGFNHNCVWMKRPKIRLKSLDMKESFINCQKIAGMLTCC